MVDKADARKVSSFLSLVKKTTSEREREMETKGRGGWEKALICIYAGRLSVWYCGTGSNLSGYWYLSFLWHCALLLTLSCWKSNNSNARVMAFTPSPALDPTFGIHSHKTLGTAQPCHLWKTEPENFTLLSVLPSRLISVICRSV